MYHCPICGETANRRGAPFTDISNVVGHINGSHDADHTAVRGEDLRAEIEATANAADAVNDPVPEEPDIDNEDGEARRFKSPRGGVAKGVLAGAVLAAASFAGLAAVDNLGGQQQDDGDPGDDIIF